MTTKRTASMDLGNTISTDFVDKDVDDYGDKVNNEMERRRVEEWKKWKMLFARHAVHCFAMAQHLVSMTHDPVLTLFAKQKDAPQDDIKDVTSRYKSLRR